MLMNNSAYQTMAQIICVKYIHLSTLAKLVYNEYFITMLYHACNIIVFHSHDSLYER